MSELVYQLEQTSASLLIVHPDVRSVAYEAADKVGLGRDRIVFFDLLCSGKGEEKDKTSSVEAIVRVGREAKQTFVERRLGKGEARRKLAFLSFSSGTTGRPKVRRYSAIYLN